MNLTNRCFHLWDGVLIPLRYAPVHMVLILLQRLISALLPALNVGITASFVDTAILVGSGAEPLSAITVPLILVIAVIAFQRLSGSLINFVTIRAIFRLREPMRRAFMEKRARLSYEHIENQKDWDLIARTCGNPEDKIFDLYSTLTGTVSLVIQVVSVMAVLMAEIWWAGLVILAVSIPLTYISYKAGKKGYDADREVTNIDRRRDYLFDKLVCRETAAERTMFGFTRKLEPRYWEAFEKARTTRLKVNLRYFVRVKAGGIASSLIAVASAMVLAPAAVVGTISVGLFISLLNALFSLSGGLSWGLADRMESLAWSREYLKDLNTFASLSEQEGACSLPIAEEPFRRLEFRHVTFRYPGSDVTILKDLSFVIERGKHYSFVGINGAGKTTITKLMTGLYPQYEGEILLNDRELRTYSLAQVKAYFCSVFQDFARYALTFRENISLGDTAALETGPIPEERLDKAIELAGLTPAAENLPKGYDSPLGKLLEDGVDLSGGEWQRVAMARTILSPAEVKILDEPTAALDPLAESEVYENFQQISEGKTTLFISHRLGSTLLADVIYVLDGGRMAECGSHQELMDKGGLYAAMFESQRSWYQ